jgi:hypothetical protein
MICVHQAFSVLSISHSIIASLALPHRLTLSCLRGRCRGNICYGAQNLFFRSWHSKLQTLAGADPGFQVRGAHLKKLRRAEGGANIFGVFRVKNHDFTPKNHISSNCGGRRENVWGISCEKSRFHAKKWYFFPIFFLKASSLSSCTSIVFLTKLNYPFTLTFINDPTNINFDPNN